MTASFPVACLREDQTGVSHFETLQIDRPRTEFAPPAPPLYVSDPGRAMSYLMVHLPPGWVGEPHPSPGRQLLFCLSGAFTVTAGDGETRSFGAGDAFLMEDTQGPGHRTEVTSGGPVDAVIIRLAQQV